MTALFSSPPKPAAPAAPAPTQAAADVQAAANSQRASAAQAMGYNQTILGSNNTTASPSQGKTLLGSAG